MANILDKICESRQKDLESKGLSFGIELPKKRIVPLIKPSILNADSSYFVIAEIKRSSPSAGHISDIANPINLAREYLNGGANAISVLCEENYFKGSLKDLIAVKNTFPNACVLRKDFILDKQEIEISYLAGADMILLIAAMFIDKQNGFAKLSEIYKQCEAFGLTPLLEVHNKQELDFIKPLDSKLIGINSRDLHTFEIDIIKACKLKEEITNAKVIFESGIKSSHHGFILGTMGFNGMLCGGYLASADNPTKTLQNLISNFNKGAESKPRFYKKVFDKFLDSTPLVKICGLKDLDNTLEVANIKGIDAIGFILVKNSKRFVESKQLKNTLKAIKSLCPQILRIGVIDDDKQTLNQARELYKLNLLDALQLHSIKDSCKFGEFDLNEADFCFYEVQNVANKKDYMTNFAGVFCLLDSKGKNLGGNGTQIDLNTLKKLNLPYLCVAGGIGIDNVKEILDLKPAMIDINSCVESAPAYKDAAKIKALLNKIYTK